MATLINTDTNLPKVLEDEGRGMSNKFRSGENRFPCPPRWYFPREKQDKTLLFFFPVRKAGSSCWNSGQIPDLAVVLLQSPTPLLLRRQGVVENVQKVGREKGKKREKKRKTRGWNKIKESHRWPVTFYRVNVGSERERKRWKEGREREKNGGGKKCERCARRRIIGICSWGRIQIGPTLECRPASSVVTVIKRSWYPAGSNAHGRVCARSHAAVCKHLCNRGRIRSIGVREVHLRYNIDRSPIMGRVEGSTMGQIFRALDYSLSSCYG